RRREDSRSFPPNFFEELLVTEQEQVHSDRLVRKLARPPDQRANVIRRQPGRADHAEPARFRHMTDELAVGNARAHSRRHDRVLDADQVRERRANHAVTLSSRDESLNRGKVTRTEFSEEFAHPFSRPSSRKPLKVETTGFEPATPCLQSRCSTS